MRNIRVALLDSGIMDELDQDIIIKEKKSFSYDYNNSTIIESECITDTNGHGTMCVHTILSAFEHIDFSIIRILNVSGVTNEDVLIKALQYVRQLDIDIVAICASLRFNKKSQKLKEVCGLVSQSGKIIIASVENEKKVSEPASYNCVLGVLGENMNDNEFYCNINSKIQMQCSSHATVTIGAFGVRTIFQGNSRATALATAHIAKALYECNGSINSLNDILSQKSCSSKVKRTCLDRRDNYVRIPFNKEREADLIKNSSGYRMLIYALCEFYLCDIPNRVRTQNLIDFEGRYILRKMENFLCYIEELFEIKLDNLKLEDLQWAYLFYDRCLNKEI